RNDHRDVHFPFTHVDDPEITIALDVHLAEVGDVPDFGVMRDKGQATRPETARSHQSEPAADNRAQPVRAYDVAGAKPAWRAIRSHRADSLDATRCISDNVRDTDAFMHARA